jgi:DNA-binding PadR family transcriptional regulator
MAKGDLLTRIEEVVLTAVAGVAGQAYGMSIFDECLNLTGGRYVAIGSIYTILDRLEKKGLVETWFEEASDPLCHNRKRCFRITEAGIRAIRETAELSRSLRMAWNTIPRPLRPPKARPLLAGPTLAKSSLEDRTSRAS